jgi:hypothetical protein
VDVESPAPKKLLAIDWANIRITNDAEALALWREIGPTGADWNAKLDEVPSNQPIARQLAVAMLHDGNFACRPRPLTTHNCMHPPIEVEEPEPTAGLGDPCLRRLLALWSMDQLEEDDIPNVRDALFAIAALPPPESQLVATAIHAVPEADHDARLKVLVDAWAAGQHELVNANLGGLDEPHLITALTKHHIDGALEVLSAEADRAAYLAAILDEALAAKARIAAITELVAVTDVLRADTRAALVGATKSADCEVAAMAARKLVQFGDAKLAPRRPHTRSADAMLRGLCVLASYEQLQPAGEASLLETYLPPRGLERIEISYDPFGVVDTDGDGDPRTERKTDLVPRAEASLPDLDEMIRAMPHCKGTTCTSNDREFRFTFKPGAGGELFLARIESAERPPCQDR